MVELVPDHSIEAFLDRGEWVVVHIDADWDVKYRPIMRGSMAAAAERFGDRVAFGEVDCDLPLVAEFCRRLNVVNVPSIAYFRCRELLEMPCFLHDVGDRLALLIAADGHSQGHGS